MSDKAPAPTLIPAGPLQVTTPEWPGFRERWIIEPPPTAWAGYAISHWELSAQGYSDRHPHDEVVIIEAGELHVEANGHEVVARAGDSVLVPAGATGHYWAPHYARMLSVYGPNPEGAETDVEEYWGLDSR